MLGFVQADGRGAGDRVLAAVAARLAEEGLRLAGAVQHNTETAAGLACDMDLHLLPGGTRVRISQRLGALAKGCRLDPAGLETAVGLVEAALDAGPHLLIVNKFGKQEGEGRGFRPLIGRALAAGVPVLTAVSALNLPAFLAFADGMAEELPADEDAILAWCGARLAA